VWVKRIVGQVVVPALFFHFLSEPGFSGFKDFQDTRVAMNDSVASVYPKILDAIGCETTAIENGTTT
jgi:hypothetical protein